jgi:hypothetical protein
MRVNITCKQIKHVCVCSDNLLLTLFFFRNNRFSLTRPENRKKTFFLEIMKSILCVKTSYIERKKLNLVTMASSHYLIGNPMH